MSAARNLQGSEVRFEIQRSARQRLATVFNEKTKRLDFKGVKSVGQGFADEIFRVYAARHPDVEIKVENAGHAVTAMIRHVGAGNIGTKVVL